MANDALFDQGLLIGFLLKQNTLQKQIIEQQQTIIKLQEKINQLTPAPVDNDVHWHIASGGVKSDDIANSEDLHLVRQFYQWNIDFAKKYVQPYVNPKVYSEVVNQMTRGLSEQISKLESTVTFECTNPPSFQHDVDKIKDIAVTLNNKNQSKTNKKKAKSKTENKSKQLVLIH